MFWLVLTWLAAPALLILASLRRPKTIHRILVIQTAKIGDFINTTPVFRALKNQLPGVHVTALVNPVTLPLATRLDSIDAAVALPDHGFRGFKGKKWLYGLLRKNFDAVLVLSPNLPTFLLPLWARLPLRISVLPDRRKGIARLAWPLLTYGEPHEHGRLFRATALQALKGLGIKITDEVLSLPNEVPPASPQAAERAQNLICQRLGPHIGLGLSAGNLMKALPGDVLFSLVAAVLAQTEANVVLVGTHHDQRLATAISARFGSSRVVDTTGQWALADLPALLAMFKAYIGVDSGVTYMADAIGIPVIDIMGPADSLDQRPLDPKAVIIPAKQECAPCSHTFDAPYHCRYEHRNCLGIADAEVLVPLRKAIGS